ncbi:MAG: hypothetical protein HOW97_07385, partial [Catenulispora sp.]|nr:hypothetical protein [Catenulispora sp.]
PASAAADPAPKQPAPTDPRVIARAQAKATGKAVAVDALATSSSDTVANPDGTFTWTSYVEPKRAWKDGAWAPVDASLKKNPDGTLSPAATTGTLVLSGGGTGPLATLSVDDKSMSLTFPMALPAPSVAGDTATYPEVLPGVDLVVTATIRGGLSEVLVVKNAAAAADPALAALHVATTTHGLTISTDAGGNMHAADAAGQTYFAAPTPTMWDSAAAANVPPGLPAKADRTGPAVGGHRKPLAVKPGSGGFDLVPDHSMLTSPTALFPLYVDPAWTTTIGNDNGGTTNYLAHWDGVQQCAPGTSNYDSHAYGDPGVGYQGFASACGTGVERAYYDVNMPPFAELHSGAYVMQGWLHTEVSYAASNGTHSDTVDVAATGAIGPGTTWNSQPCRWDIANARCSSGIAGKTTITTSGNNPYMAVQFDITGMMNSAVQAGYPDLTVGLFNENESDAYSFLRFATTVHTYFTALYDYSPPAPSGNDMSSNPVAQNGDGSPCANNGVMGRSSSANNAVTLYQKVFSGMPITGTDPNPQIMALFFARDNTTGQGLTPGNGGLGNNGAYAPSGSVFSYTIGGLTDGHSYSWWTNATDGTLTSGPGPSCTFVADFTSPAMDAAGSPQFPAGGSGLHAHINGNFTVSAHDPGMNASGLWCYKYVFDGTLSVPPAFNACNPGPGVVMASQIGAATGSTVLNWTPPIWGTHQLQVQVVDRGGNTSQPLTYVFYVQDDPNAKPTPGDLSGDGVPDYLRVDSAGNLVMYQAGMDTANTGQVISPAAEAPAHSGTWAGWQLTRRGSMTGQYVDDLIVHRTGSADADTVYIYQNDGAGHFTAGQSSLVAIGDDPGNTADPDTSTRGGINTCACDLTKATQIVAIGYGDGGSANPHYPLPPQTPMSRNPAYFLAVIPDAAGNGQEWLFSYHGTNTVYGYGQPISAFTSNVLGSMRLFSPGDTNGDGMPDLWGVNTGTGEVVQFASALTATGTADWKNGIGRTTAAHVTTMPSGYDLTSVTAPGNRDSSQHLELLATTTGGTVNALSTPSGTTAAALLSYGSASSANGPKVRWTFGNSSAPQGTTPPANSTVVGDIATLSAHPDYIQAAYDTSGNANTGTVYGGVFTDATHDGHAATFSGGGAVSMPNGLIASTTTQSVAMWFKTPKGSTATGTLLSTGNSPAGTGNPDSRAMPVLYVGSDGYLYGHFWNMVVAGIKSSTTVNDGAWHQVVLVGAATNQALYVDGNLVGTLGGQILNVDPVNIVGAGVYNSNGWPAAPSGGIWNYFTGTIDNFQIFQRVVGPSEVTSLYDAGRPQPRVPTQVSVADPAGATTVCTSTATAAVQAATATGSPVSVDSLTPTLNAQVADSDATVATHGEFEVWDATDPTQPQPVTWGDAHSATAAGSGPGAAVTTPTLTNGHTYGWQARTVAEDGSGSSDFGPACYFTVSTDGTVKPLSGAQILPGDDTIHLASQNTTWQGPKTRLVFQTDGNLVVYRTSDNVPVWNSATAGHPDAALVVQKDGNMVIYDGVPTVAGNGWVTGNGIWRTSTSGKGIVKLVVQTDGNVVLYSVGSGAIWSSATVTP